MSEPIAPANPPFSVRPNHQAVKAVLAGLLTCAIGAAGVVLTRTGVSGLRGMAGIALCVLLTALVGLGFGVIGLARGRDRRVGRAGVAMIGVMLSVLGLFFSFMALGAILQGRSMEQAKPAIDNNAQFVMLVGSGNISAAKGLCTPGIDETVLTDATEKFEGWGVIQNVDKHWGGEVHNENDIEVWTLIRFDKTAQILKGRWVRQDGLLRLNSFHFEDAPASATQPAN